MSWKQQTKPARWPDLPASATDKERRVHVEGIDGEGEARREKQDKLMLQSLLVILALERIVLVQTNKVQVDGRSSSHSMHFNLPVITISFPLIH